MKRVSRGDRITDIVSYILLSIVLLLCLYPVYFVIVASFSHPTAVNSGRMLLWPEGFNLDGYEYVFNDQRIWRGYGNTIIYVVFGTLLGLFACLTGGYALSRKDLPGRKIIMGLYVFTMYFSGGLIPGYLVVKSLGLLNTRAILVILGSVSVYNIILIRTFFQSNLPEELRESAFIDGCGNLRFFVQFALPLSKAIIAVISLYLAVGYWNSYFTALIYATDSRKHPLQLVLRQMLLTDTGSEVGDPEGAAELGRIMQVIKYAIIVVSTLPVMCVYPFLQKYFVQGVMIGSLKG